MLNNSLARKLEDSSNQGLEKDLASSPPAYVNWDNSNPYVNNSPQSYTNLRPQPKLRLLEKNEELLENERYEAELDAKVKAENDYWASDNVLEIERILNGRGKNYFKLNDRLTALTKYLASDSFTKDAEILRAKNSGDYWTITQRLSEEIKKISQDNKYLEKTKNGKLDENLYNLALDSTKLALKKLKSKSAINYNHKENRLRLMKENPSHFFPEDLYKHGLISDDEFTKYKTKKEHEEKIQSRKKRNRIIAGVAAASIVAGSLFAGAFYKYTTYNTPRFKPNPILVNERITNDYISFNR